MTQEGQLWKLTAAQMDGAKRIYRVRQTVPEGLNKGDFSEVVIIDWRFGDAGLPTPQMGETMQGFEAYLDPLNDHSSNAILIHVYTGTGIREWCYYVKSYDRFMADMNAALAGKPPFPIQIVHDRDPAWSYQAKIKRASEGGA